MALVVVAAMEEELMMAEVVAHLDYTAGWSRDCVAKIQDEKKEELEVVEYSEAVHTVIGHSQA